MNPAPRGESLCLFCGRLRRDGVAGPTPEIYICRDCIELAAEIVADQRSEATD